MSVKVLVTGGAGFIGVHVAKANLERGRKVFVVDDFSRPGTQANLKWLKSLGGRLEVKELDIVKGRRFLERSVQDFDVVYHLAAQVAVTSSLKDPRRDFEVNVLGTINVLEAIRKSRKKPILLFASTNKVYGKMEEVEVLEKKKRYAYRNRRWGVSESQPLDFYSPYGCSKGSAEQYVRDYARMYKIKTVVFRQSCIYGEHQFGVEDQGWVAWFCIAALLGKPITIYGDGKQVRDLLSISDLVRAFELAVRYIQKTAGQVYNIGGGPKNTLSLLELHALLEKKLKKKIPLRFSDWRPGDQKVYVSDIRKARRDFLWEPKVPPQRGVERLLRWVREHRTAFNA